MEIIGTAGALSALGLPVSAPGLTATTESNLSILGHYRRVFGAYAEFAADLPTLADGIYRITQDEQLQADEGLSFAPASARAVAGGVVTGTENLSNVPYANGNNSAVRTVQERLQEVLYVEDFRATSDTDVQVWQKAVNEMIARKMPLKAGSRRYYFDTHVTLASTTYCDIDFTNCIIVNTSPFPKIASQTAADFSIPSNTDAGPLRGCAFYMASGDCRGSRFIGGRFENFRFVFAFLQPHNGPLFALNNFRNCNCGIICYRGSQNYTIVPFPHDASTTGVYFIGGATCFPSGSPYANTDAYYVDGFQLTCDGSGGYQTIGTVVQPDFDDWFEESILRPLVPSYSLYSQTGQLYDYADDRTKPTGRIAYIPMRNPRAIWTPSFNRLRLQDTPRGLALLDWHVMNLHCEHIHGELYTAQAIPAYITVGAVYSATIVETDYVVSDGFDSKFISVTGRGKVSPASGFENITVIGGRYWEQAVDQYEKTVTSISARSAAAQLLKVNTDRDASSVGEATSYFVYESRIADAGLALASRELGQVPVEHGGLLAISLPKWSDTENVWKNLVEIGTNARYTNCIMTVDVINATTGEQDSGVYAVTLKPRSITEPVLTLAAPANNGDTTITVTSSTYTPDRLLTHLALLSIDSIRVVVNYALKDGTIHLISPIYGLPATVPSGTTVALGNSTIAPISKPQRQWVEPYIVNNAVLGLKRINHTSPEVSLTGDVFRVFVRFHSYQGGRVGALYSADVPTTGAWERGAIQNVVGAVGGNRVLERTCIASGTPGTWRASKWYVSVGPTSSRPVLTAADIGVMYMDTSLAAGGRPIWWTGTSWVDHAGAVV